MKLEEMNRVPMFALVAPDGTVQPATFANDMAECFAVLKLMARSGIGTAPATLIRQGFRIMPVSVTIHQNGPIDERSNLALTGPKGGVKATA